MIIGVGGTGKKINWIWQRVFTVCWSRLYAVALFTYIVFNTNLLYGVFNCQLSLRHVSFSAVGHFQGARNFFRRVQFWQQLT